MESQIHSMWLLTTESLEPTHWLEEAWTYSIATMSGSSIDWIWLSCHMRLLFTIAQAWHAPPSDYFKNRMDGQHLISNIFAWYNNKLTHFTYMNHHFIKFSLQTAYRKGHFKKEPKQKRKKGLWQR
ncbi:hypothetical protein ACJX0J_009898 [Zea mays]